MVFWGQRPGLQKHDRRVFRVFVVVQRLRPEHPERLDDIVIGAVIRVLPNLENQVVTVLLIVQDVNGLSGTGQRPGLLPAEAYDVSHAVELLPYGCQDTPLIP